MSSSPVPPLIGGGGGGGAGSGGEGGSAGLATGAIIGIVVGSVACVALLLAIAAPVSLLVAHAYRLPVGDANELGHGLGVRDAHADATAPTALPIMSHHPYRNRHSGSAPKYEN